MKQTFLRIASAALLGLVCLITMGSAVAPSVYYLVQNAGSAVAREGILNFTGAGVSVADDPTNHRTTVTIAGAANANFQQTFTSQTSVALTHNLNTTTVLVSCYDASNVEILPNSTTITSVNVVTVTFSIAQTGLCNVNGALGAGGGGSSITPGQLITASSGGLFYGPTFTFTNPTTTSFTAFNQVSGSSTDTSHGILTLVMKNSGAGGSYAGVETAMPAAPFTMIAALSASYGSFGLYERNNSTDVGRVIRYQGNAGGQFLCEQTFMSTFGSYSQFCASGNAGYNTAVIWFRIQDDATNTTFSTSPDGYNWMVAGRVADNIGANVIGIVCQNGDQTLGGAGTVNLVGSVWSLAITTP